MRWARHQLAWSTLVLGHWDEALRQFDAFIAECEADLRTISRAPPSMRPREDPGGAWRLRGCRDRLRAGARAHAINDRPAGTLPGLASTVAGFELLGRTRRRPEASQRSTSVASPTSQPRRGSRSRANSLTRARLWSSSRATRSAQERAAATLDETCARKPRSATSCVRPRCGGGRQPDLEAGSDSERPKS